MISSPFFSVIVPTYNRAKYVVNAIESLLQQNFSDFEILVIDDGSTDNTSNVIRSIQDSRVKYFYTANTERGAARNFGVTNSNGQYITFLDSDDIVYPIHLKEAKNVIDIHHFPEWFHLGYEVRSGNKVLWKENKKKGDQNKRLIKGNFLSCMGVFLRRDIALKHQFDESRTLSGSEDWHLWMRLASRYPLYYSNLVTGCINQHDERSVIKINAKQIVSRINYVYNSLIQDPEVTSFFNFNDGKIKTYLNLYLSLHLALGNYRMLSIKYLLESVKEYPAVIFKKRWIIVIIKLFYKKNLF